MKDLVSIPISTHGQHTHVVDTDVDIMISGVPTFWDELNVVRIRVPFECQWSKSRGALDKPQPAQGKLFTVALINRINRPPNVYRQVTHTHLHARTHSHFLSSSLWQLLKTSACSISLDWISLKSMLLIKFK